MLTGHDDVRFKGKTGSSRPTTKMTRLRTDIAVSIATSSRSRLEPSCCRSQALYLFVHLLGFLVELHELGFLRRIVAAQLVEHFADREFIYFGHRNPPPRGAKSVNAGL